MRLRRYHIDMHVRVYYNIKVLKIKTLKMINTTN